MKSAIKLLTFVAALTAFTATANAVVILQYNAANNGVTSMAPVVVDAGVSGDDMMAGAGITPGTGSTWNFTDWDPANTSYADAVAADEVWTWGFDVTSATPLNLTTMDIRLDRSGTGPDDVEIQVSLNGGTPTTVLTHDYMDGTSGVDFLGLDLSSLSGLTAGDSVVFKLGAFNAESTAGTFDLENLTFPDGDDGIIINGRYVPEPGCLGLGLALAGLLCSAIVRRR